MTSVLLRHASAGDRDRLGRRRPSSARSTRAGVASPQALVELLRPFGVRRVVSSPYVRCVQTVEPLAAALGLPLEQDDRLAEGAGAAAAGLLREDGVVCCTHGDIVEELLDRGLKKGAALVLETGQLVRELSAAVGLRGERLRARRGRRPRGCRRRRRAA